MGWDKRREEHNADQRAQSTTVTSNTPKATVQVSTAWVDHPGSDVSLPFSNTPIHLVGPRNQLNVSK
jgi:hypothetical protein